MKDTAVALLVACFLFAASCTGRTDASNRRAQSYTGHAVTGHVLLPEGEGRRGVELWITTRAHDQSPSARWVLFDHEGRFEHPLQPGARPMSVNISAAGIDVFRLETEPVPIADATGMINLGTIDLRDRLVRRRLTLHAAQGAPRGDIRVAAWPGSPPTGPRGEPVSLGSAQFPTIALGDETEWLLPPHAATIYFLVERPIGAAREKEWRSGYQQLYGPFAVSDLPTELVVAGE